MTREQMKTDYLSNPTKFLFKKPFRRGIQRANLGLSYGSCEYNELQQVELPDIQYNVVSQAQFMKELDPMSHDVLFDANIPSICIKLQDGGYQEVKYSRMPLAIQRNIRDKQVLHLCNNKMVFTLMDAEPTDEQKSDFILFKQYWDLRNQDGMKTKMVTAQKGLGDAGLLYYFDYNGCIKSRLLAYPDYTIIPINDNNGDRLFECLYYSTSTGGRIDVYDDTFIYSFANGNSLGDNVNKNGWRLTEAKPHGFDEIPLITKRGDVAWNNVQPLIETYEIIYNIYNVIQKRQGWGILFLKGNLSSKLDVLNGSLIAQSSGIDTDKTDMKYLTPPTGEGMKMALELLEEQIQKGAGFTQILPKDIKTSGDISGVAIQLTMSLDNAIALQGVTEWQNVADKMVRLFKYGLAKELVNKKIKETAFTSFQNLNIYGQFKNWQPKSETEYNNMLISLKGAGLLSEQTGVEKNTESSPDEILRIGKEKEKKIELLEIEEAIKNNDNNNSINEIKVTEEN